MQRGLGHIFLITLCLCYISVSPKTNLEIYLLNYNFLIFFISYQKIEGSSVWLMNKGFETKFGITYTNGMGAEG